MALEIPAGGVPEVGEDGANAGDRLGFGEGEFGAAVFVRNFVGALDLNGVEGTTGHGR